MMHPLQNLIYKKGYNMTSFAEKANIDRTTLYKLFSGTIKQMRKDTQYKVSETLHEPIEKIIELTTEGL